MPFPALFKKRRTEESNVPSDLQLAAHLEFSATQSKDKTKPARFQLTAYTGSAMHVEGFFYPVVIDLAGAEFEKDSTPVIADHDTSLRIGHTTEQSINRDGIFAEGIVSSKTGIATGFVEDARAGYPFEVSVGASVLQREIVNEGNTVEVNGDEFTGPLIIARKTTIRELSVTVLGADSKTTATLVATQPKRNGDHSMPMNRSAVASEERRVDGIKAAATQFSHLQSIEVDGSQVPMNEFKAQAIESGMTLDAFELTCMQTDMGTSTGPVMFNVPDEGQVLEAAMARHAGLNIESHFDERVCEASDRLPITSLMDAAKVYAQRAGQSFNPRNANEVLRAAYSTSEFSVMLSNVANKSALEVYRNFPSTARLVAKKLEANNFHEHTGIRLGGDTIFQEVAGDGELKHTKLTDDGFTYKIATYGRIWGIDRQSVINDDTSALGDVPKIMTRGALLAVEEVFWNLVLANTGSFFSVGNGNLISGAGSELSGDSLASAVQAFMEATDSENKPIGVLPKWLVVPPALKAQADQLYTSRTVHSGGGSTTTNDRVPDANPFFGLYEPIASPWIGTNQAASGGSDTHWFLFGDKSDVAPFGLAYLDGNERPTIEPVELPAHQLGIGFRGYIDFGACQIEPAGAVKSAGA